MTTTEPARRLRLAAIIAVAVAVAYIVVIPLAWVGVIEAKGGLR